jgi:hypothetical protein
MNVRGNDAVDVDLAVYWTVDNVVERTVGWVMYGNMYGGAVYNAVYNAVDRDVDRAVYRAMYGPTPAHWDNWGDT